MVSQHTETVRSGLAAGLQPAARVVRQGRFRVISFALLLALLALTLLSACGLPGTIAGGGALPATRPVPTATPLPPVRFPQDEAPHTNLTEWWYYTGHFHSASGHEYGFELTFFQTLRG
jgi:predicted secreted hydrolase